MPLRLMLLQFLYFGLVGLLNFTERVISTSAVPQVSGWIPETVLYREFRSDAASWEAIGNARKVSDSENNKNELSMGESACTLLSIGPRNFHIQQYLVQIYVDGRNAARKRTQVER
ncbi:hypothetical protein BV25DRAFT_1838138 [Artomyces pyxidatus]|uniref:Uncharacterized protein n=1 Tax=Artomyces pyxidatus TaxID=48021 RepID=A0ACB8T2E4_9AGAM|nr:hypothetical protein BV25DRAFT_1838138 [Artomyces pyxidatus]